MCASAHPARKFAAIRWSVALKRRNGMQGLQVVNNLERCSEDGMSQAVKNKKRLVKS